MARHARTKPGLHDQAWHYLLGLGPDLAFVQEALPPAWVRGKGTLVHGPFKEWGSLIFSPRYPLERFTLPADSHLRSLGTYLAFAVASLPDGSDAFVASVHARDDFATKAQLGEISPATAARPSRRSPRVNDIVFVGLAELAREHPPFIVGGDWNTGRAQRNLKAAQEFFLRARDSDWYDCVYETLDHELQTGYGKGLLKQNDHVFCDMELAKRLHGPPDHLTPRVASEAATDMGLSDHAPLIIDFDMSSIAMTSLEEGDKKAPN